ncbi:MAG: hypothetical protein BWK77_01405 [Verrucomicrobia bacterium A1]|nr:MAG: hypothetical protein BWK77_01405 [Verrucomicrobia bacterium A1]
MKHHLAVSAAVLLGATSFAPAAEPRPWDEYRVILWTGDSAWASPDRAPIFFERLRELGATHGMVHGRADSEALRKAGIPFYVENMVSRGLCLKWNSRVSDWDGFVTGWAKDRNREAFIREYGLCDPAWRASIDAEVRTLVTRHAPHAPLAYDLRDEISITISANPFDYDFSPPTLAAFRAGLRTTHGSLDALNRAWDTRFASWDAVLPFTTDEIKNRMSSGGGMPRGQPDWQALARLAYDPAEARKEPARWNLAPWCDFRSFLDATWAGILDGLRRSARAIDPATPVGIEGTQMPHPFGGYDLWRLSQALDWIEPYDIGGARAIFGSFMEGKPVLSTIGEANENAARRRLWHLLLEGDRGCVIWWSEDCIDWKTPGHPLTVKGRALAPVMREMTGSLAGLFVRARREWDPVAIHYSQPSVQVNWLIESTGDGRTWHRRFSSYEATHNRQAAGRVAWLRQLRRARVRGGARRLRRARAPACRVRVRSAARLFRRRGGCGRHPGSRARDARGGGDRGIPLPAGGRAVDRTRARHGCPDGGGLEARRRRRGVGNPGRGRGGARPPRACDRPPQRATLRPDRPGERYNRALAPDRSRRHRRADPRRRSGGVSPARGPGRK